MSTEGAAKSGVVITDTGRVVEVRSWVSEGTTSAQRILKTVPLKACAVSGCNYPQGDCSGECLPGGVRP